MMLNCYENTYIRNSNLPVSWRSDSSLDDLGFFLQKNWEQRGAFFRDGKVSSKQQFLSFAVHGSIKTNNYVGSIVFKGEQLNIFPKVFRSDVDDNDTKSLSQQHLIMNLVKWLEYCSKIDYPYISISSELNETDDLKQLFISLYLKYVSAAVERGAYYQYVEETDDYPFAKGSIDIVDYYTRKIPHMRADKFRCTHSNFELDNQLNRILKYTCWMLQNETGRKNQRVIRNILNHLSEVSFVRCNASDCDKIRLTKLHTQYRIILSMSKMFLLNKMSSYTIDTSESFCFLFPMELIFEGFIGGFIQEAVTPKGGKVRLQASEVPLIDDVIFEGVSLGSAFEMRHDILIETPNKVFILDTKYKQLHRFEGDHESVRKIVTDEPKQTDIYQVCEYARKRNIDDVYLLYPMFRYEDIEPSFPVGISRNQTGDQEIRVHFVRLPFVFEESDNDSTRAQLLRTIYEIVYGSSL